MYSRGIAVLAGIAGLLLGLQSVLGAQAGSVVTDHVTLGVRPWFSEGADQWQISFGEDDPDLGWVGGKSELKWKKLKSTVPVFYGEVRIASWLRVGGSYGDADIQDGASTDTDTLDAPDFDYNNFVISQSTSETDGSTTFYDVNVYFRLNSLLTVYETEIPGNLDLYVGYQSYKDDLHDQNGVQTVLDQVMVDEPFDGLDSTFSFDWTAYRIGLQGEYPVVKHLLVKGDAAVLFDAKYKGDGFWNLRDDYKSTPPNFTQEADAGTGYDVKLGLAFKPVEYVSLEAGYWWFGLEADNGQETTYYADGTTSEENVDKAKSERNGFFVALSGNF